MLALLCRLGSGQRSCSSGGLCKHRPGPPLLCCPVEGILLCQAGVVWHGQHCRDGLAVRLSACLDLPRTVGLQRKASRAGVDVQQCLLLNVIWDPEDGHELAWTTRSATGATGTKSGETSDSLAGAVSAAASSSAAVALCAESCLMKGAACTPRLASAAAMGSSIPKSLPAHDKSNSW